eukprot:TRINITY_DN4448_c0_g1_i1.p1 TRINITY_DN4448_c0_g1~~TRINITY_DN4448_c0_g1_i1.p1  ORF type:complete len:434 (+),score=97.02 TRINITY_DN4448_c0_g1_i1:162-1304(+)
MGNKQGNTSVIAGSSYSRLRVLGKGSFGKVYAMQHQSGVVRVIKEMNKRDINEKGKSAVNATSQERVIFSHLKGCPYVCRSFAAYQDDTNLYMLLEYCPGGELEYHLAERGVFSEEDVICYAAQLVFGLHKMHTEYHVIHRDLKPENVLLTEAGYCRLIDLNISILCDSAKCKVENIKRQTVGTMPYIAPELLRGEPHDMKVDWWSLAVMMLLMVSGRLPFNLSKSGATSSKKKKHQMLAGIEETPLKTVFKKARARLAALDEPMTISSDFESLVSKMLHQNPAKRIGGEAIMKHRLFKDIDWGQIETQTLPKLPLVPRADQVNFNNEANVEDIFGMDKHSKKALTEEEQALYSDWNWVAEDQELPPEEQWKSTKKKKKK